MVWPTTWEWVGILLAIIGILMAVQPFLQMIYGQPKLSIRPSVVMEKETAAIGLHVSNPPITEWWLSLLGVTKQTAEGVVISYMIDELESGKSILPVTFSHTYTGAGNPAKRVDIAASDYASFIPIGAVNKGKVYLDKGGGSELQLLAIGKYKVIVIIVYGSKKELAYKHLIVSENTPYASWEMTADES